MMRARFIVLLAVLGLLTLGTHVRAQKPDGSPKSLDKEMSPMGKRALHGARARALEYLKEKGLIDLPDEDGGDGGDTEPVQCDDNGCDPGSDEEGDAPNAAQSELSIAIDASGSHIVIGFNDFRGFNTNPLTISGFAYSDDGGATFVDGGQLPVVANGQISGTFLPQVSGDPDVKYVPGGGGCQFIYSSILLKGIGGTAPNFAGTAQT